MLHRQIITVLSENHMKYTSALCGQNVEFLNVQPVAVWRKNWALKGWSDNYVDVCALLWITLISRYEMFLNSDGTWEP
jgi:hypothetical protein